MFTIICEGILKRFISPSLDPFDLCRIWLHNNASQYLCHFAASIQGGDPFAPIHIPAEAASVERSGPESSPASSPPARSGDVQCPPLVGLVVSLKTFSMIRDFLVRDGPPILVLYEGSPKSKNKPSGPNVLPCSRQNLKVILSGLIQGKLERRRKHLAEKASRLRRLAGLAPDASGTGTGTGSLPPVAAGGGRGIAGVMVPQVPQHHHQDVGRGRGRGQRQRIHRAGSDSVSSASARSASSRRPLPQPKSKPKPKVQSGSKKSSFGGSGSFFDGDEWGALDWDEAKKSKKQKKKHKPKKRQMPTVPVSHGRHHSHHQMRKKNSPGERRGRGRGRGHKVPVAPPLPTKSKASKALPSIPIPKKSTRRHHEPVTVPSILPKPSIDDLCRDFAHGRTMRRFVGSYEAWGDKMRSLVIRTPEGRRLGGRRNSIAVLEFHSQKKKSEKKKETATPLDAFFVAAPAPAPASGPPVVMTGGFVPIPAAISAVSDKKTEIGLMDEAFFGSFESSAGDAPDSEDPFMSIHKSTSKSASAEPSPEKVVVPPPAPEEEDGEEEDDQPKPIQVSPSELGAHLDLGSILSSPATVTVTVTKKGKGEPEEEEGEGIDAFLGLFNDSDAEGNDDDDDGPVVMRGDDILSVLLGAEGDSPMTQSLVVSNKPKPKQSVTMSLPPKQQHLIKKKTRRRRRRRRGHFRTKSWSTRSSSPPPRPTGPASAMLASDDSVGVFLKSPSSGTASSRGSIGDDVDVPSTSPAQRLTAAQSGILTELVSMAQKFRLQLAILEVSFITPLRPSAPAEPMMEEVAIPKRKKKGMFSSVSEVTHADDDDLDPFAMLLGEDDADDEPQLLFEPEDDLLRSAANVAFGRRKGGFIPMKGSSPPRHSHSRKSKKRVVGILDDFAFRSIFQDILPIVRSSRDVDDGLGAAVKGAEFPSEISQLEATLTFLEGFLVTETKFFEEYFSYFVVFPRISELVATERSRNSRFASFLSKTAQDLGRMGEQLRQLDSFMVLPVHHLPRYKMLLKSLLREFSKTTSAKDDDDDDEVGVKSRLAALLKEVEHRAERCVQALMKSLRIEKLLQLERRLGMNLRVSDSSNSIAPPSFDRESASLAAAFVLADDDVEEEGEIGSKKKRKYIADCVAWRVKPKKTYPIHLHLFSDLLVLEDLRRKRRRRKCTVVCPLGPTHHPIVSPLHYDGRGLVVVVPFRKEVVPEEGSPALMKKTVESLQRLDSIVHLSCASEKQRNELVAAIRKAALDCRSE